jgi:hypothetical protein
MNLTAIDEIVSASAASTDVERLRVLGTVE